MNDRDFEKLLATELAKPLAQEPSTELVRRVLARADGARRTKQLVVAAAATIGVVGTLGIVATFASLDAAARGFVAVFESLPGQGMAPIAVACLLVTLVTGLRSRVA